MNRDDRPMYVIPVGEKSIGVAYAWWLLGIFGCHQFYMGKIGRGFIYLITLGGFLVLWFIDLFTLPTQVRRVNRSGY